MSCPHFPELSLDEWGRQLLAPLEGRRYPLGGTLELTDRCNYRCVHCYINQPAGSRAAQATELTSAQIAGLLDQLAEAGCLFLLLTGGEALLRPDFPEIYRQAVRHGMLISIFTNGALITQPVADLLAAERPFSIEITLYGATRETYDQVTQVPGSYARCRAGIDLLLERGLPLTLKTVLMTTNRHELAEMAALAGQLGVKFRYDGMLWPRVDGSKQPLQFQIALEDLIALDYNDPERQQEWQKTAESFNGHLVRSEYVYTCGAGLQSFHIDSQGRLSLCTMARRPAFDLLQMSFAEAWERLGSLREQKRQLDTPCRTCTVGALCTQCPGWSQAVHGDDETPVEFVCALGRQRARQIQRIEHC